MKICFVGSLSTAFIKRDYDLLKKHFEISVIEPPKNLKEWVKYPLLVKRKVKESDVVFCWFAGWHSLFAVKYSNIFNKKSIVVAGGYDVVFLPEIEYGAFTSFKERISAKYVLNNSDLVISISKSNQDELLEKIVPKENVLIYNGIPINKFYPKKEKKQDIVITVGGVKWSNLKRKGLEIFVKSAKYLPNIPFVLIGNFTDDSIEYLRSIASDNVEFTGFVSDEGLLEWYQKAKVYVQPSAHEGFGITVAESMLCECVPVVTNRFSLPEVVGNVGFIAPFNNIKKTSEAINSGLNAPNELGKKARERVKKNFSLEKREEKLVETISEIYERK